jgi:cytochrome c peroxidase
MKPIPKNYDEYLKVINNLSNNLTQKKVTLGKKLYFDKSLSKNRDVSCSTCHMISKNTNEHLLLKNLTTDSNQTNCASCHIRDNSGTDRLSTAIGTAGTQNPYHLNTMTILNSSLAKYLTWSGEIQSVEEEVGASIQSQYKMNMLPQEINKRLNSNPSYIKEFDNAFNKPISSSQSKANFENTKIALGAYVRTLLTRGAYDRFLDGDNGAINEKAKKGLANFINLGCKGCHTGMSVGGQVLKRFPLKNFVSQNDLSFNFPFMLSDNGFPFNNVGGFLGKDDDHYFRVPILRNVTKTSPYFHNGSVPKIREAVRIMGQNQLGLNLSDTKIDEIVEFLKTLEGDVVDYSEGIKSKGKSL